MREIKFRIWHTRDKMYCDTVSTGAVNLVGKDLNAIYGGDCIFEQYIGIKDRNGVEIYEGSVVQSSYHKPYSIIFKDGAFGYMSEKCFLDMDFKRYMEVIGTIHDKEK